MILEIILNNFALVYLLGLGWIMGQTTFGCVLLHTLGALVQRGSRSSIHHYCHHLQYIHIHSCHHHHNHNHNHLHLWNGNMGMM